VVTPRNKATSRADRVEIRPWGRDAASAGWQRLAAAADLLRKINRGERSPYVGVCAGSRAVEIASRWLVH
jgi:hypothetical protein